VNLPLDIKDSKSVFKAGLNLKLGSTAPPSKY
jgi:hypothetical protein